MSGSIGAQVVLDPASPASQGARGVAASTLYQNTVARDLGLISNGLDPLLTAGPPTAVVPFAFNFMRPGWLDPGVTFSRSSTATYIDASGTIQTAAINVPRWDCAGGVLRGLLIEEARTNLFLNSATLSTQSVTVTAQAYTLSFYGTGTVTKSGAATGALAGTGATQRVSQTFTPTAGTVTCTVTGSVTNAQIEAGAFPTSYILTAGVAANRAMDICSVPTAAWFNGNAFTLFLEFIGPPGNNAFCGFSDATFGNSAYLGNDATPAVSITYTPTGGGSAGAAGLMTRGAVNKVACSVTSGRLAISGNGAAVGFLAMTSTPLTMATRLSFGNDPWSLSTAFGSHVRHASYWPRALSDAELQQMTT